MHSKSRSACSLFLLTYNILLSYIADIIDALSLIAFVMLDVSFDCLLKRTLAFDIKRL